MDGAEGRGTREVAARPTAVAEGTVLPPVTEADGGVVPVAVPAADGDGTQADDRGPFAQASAITGVLAVAAGQASAHAAVGPMGKEATTRPEGMDDVGTGLSSRRRRQVVKPRHGGLAGPVAPREASVAGRPVVADVAVAILRAAAVAMGVGLMATRVPEVAGASTRPMAADAVADGVQVGPFLEVTVAVLRTHTVATNGPEGPEARQGGLPGRPVEANRQVLVGLQPQGRIAAGVNQGLLPPAAGAGLMVRPSSRADEEPRGDGP